MLTHTYIHTLGYSHMHTHSRIFSFTHTLKLEVMQKKKKYWEILQGYQYVVVMGRLTICPPRWELQVPVPWTCSLQNSERHGAYRRTKMSCHRKWHRERWWPEATKGSLCVNFTCTHNLPRGSNPASTCAAAEGVPQTLGSVTEVGGGGIERKRKKTREKTPEHGHQCGDCQGRQVGEGI